MQLAEGWIKRVLAGINPFEQRFKSFENQTGQQDRQHDRASGAAL